MIPRYVMLLLFLMCVFYIIQCFLLSLFSCFVYPLIIVHISYFFLNVIAFETIEIPALNMLSCFDSISRSAGIESRSICQKMRKLLDEVGFVNRLSKLTAD